MKYCALIYKLTAKFPEEEKFGLISQLRRAAVSVPSNRAEGSAKSSDRHFIVFLENSLGSCREIDTQLLVAIELGFINQEDASEALSELYRIMVMLNNFITKIKSNLK